MKFFHLSDLHIGKRLNHFSLIEDQEYILNKIIEYVDEIKPDAIMLAGDIYDRSIPPIEAVKLFDGFLSELENRDLMVFMISGNHDSLERVSFASSIMKKNKIYIAPRFMGEIYKVEVDDINIYMLPFVKPSDVRLFYPDKEIKSYEDALKAIIESTSIDKTKKNILITHQYIQNASLDDSEDFPIGGSEPISASIFDDFDYVALGHIHRAQEVFRPTIRYSGSILKYSFSEKNEKSISVIDVKEDIKISTLPLKGKRDMIKLKDSFKTITDKSFYQKLNQEDFYHITLTDEEDIINAISKLRTIYPNIMKLDYDNLRTKTNQLIQADKKIESKTPLELIDDFYKLQNNQSLADQQRELLEDLIKKIWED